MEKQIRVNIVTGQSELPGKPLESLLWKLLSVNCRDVFDTRTTIETRNIKYMNTQHVEVDSSTLPLFRTSTHPVKLDWNACSPFSFSTYCW
jgi:hypothetical protein